MPRYSITITDRVSPGHPQGLTQLPGGFKLFTKKPKLEGETATREANLSPEEAESLRREHFEVVEIEEAETVTEVDSDVAAKKLATEKAATDAADRTRAEKLATANDSARKPVIPNPAASAEPGGAL